MGEFVKVASVSEIAPGRARLVNLKGKAIALFNIEGSFFALDDACTSRKGHWRRETSRATSDLPLARGKVRYPNGRGALRTGIWRRHAL